MAHFFEAVDHSGRKIHLSTERWAHINTEHPEISRYFQDFGEILRHPTKVVSYLYDEKVQYFYKYYKQRKSESKYLLIIVKYLNGNGFIISAYFVKHIL